MAHLAGNATQQRPVLSASTSYNISSDSSDNSGDDDDNVPLPFPEALPRSDFVVADFDPAAYLSALPHRHQTLEDLRSDLRERSAIISAELVELVNSNYTAFLSLGSGLKGGDEKVGDVKVALLGFRRAVEEVKAKVVSKRDEARQLNDELRLVRGHIEEGRKMLELDDRLTMLEKRLALGTLPGSGTGDWDSDSSDEDESDDAAGLLETPPSKLFQSATQCGEAMLLKGSLPQDHPFVIKLEERLTRCRNTLLLDLGNALKEARGAGVKGHHRILKFLAIYRLLDAQSEAVRSLKGG
ncbi:hypothetical protein E4U43_008295 [Claviceps pusilla]|uniref:Conserved oligomeric Golgi complex subunit 2 n=1 Tax=Claviceps pusilla TaxID=123648 RepID=A0A9P7NB44_9HYPO|nr:hypothetical protein E4U43_008295 [Claviceps pusilla]